MKELAKNCKRTLLSLMPIRERRTGACSYNQSLILLAQPGDICVSPALPLKAVTELIGQGSRPIQAIEMQAKDADIQ